MLGNLTNEQIESVLRNAVIGRIGCCADKRVFVVPITYAYAGGYIYGHSAEGMKILMMRKNPEVCFEVDNMTDMTNWQSVVLWGTYEEIKTPDEYREAMNILEDRVKPLVVSETMRPAMRLPEPHPVNAGVKPIAYRIKIREKTGRFETHS